MWYNNKCQRVIDLQQKIKKNKKLLTKNKRYDIINYKLKKERK